MTTSDEVLAKEFSTHRGHLIGVAYRLTSTISDAEDAVQESWLRLSGLDEGRRAQILDLRGWLTTVVGRICLDRLRSAAVRRERYVGPWLPEPVVTSLDARPGDDPLETVVLNEQVRLAALLVLDKMTPEQRVAFVLHDAFAVPFGEIAEILSVTETTARQHASRGRRAVADAEVPDPADLAEQRAIVEKLLTALASGDVDGVVAALHPDAVLIGDGDGKARTARRHIVGADKVTRFLRGLSDTYGVHRIPLASLVVVNGDLGVAFPDLPAEEGYRAVDRRVSAFEVRDGRIWRIYDIVNPDKLRHLQVRP
ncbi:sigma-70 family RNA polymerase sigma factor [Actinophytocola sp.]|uniref:sigma-70 family RNA polymerase sigma factor n=1 Tax=Actinophytocola sp. TaxID=1872138 RepID=UPI002D476A7E|nr:sigma-70 family RNA polymerase sigma factor [Actinophytocola sp.]HYQ69334.1 sigma-70 family RNA polymerase sigma factor [Actinophytocola sp.]